MPLTVGNPITISIYIKYRGSMLEGRNINATV